MGLLRSFWVPAAMVGLGAVAVAEYANADASSFTLGRSTVQETNSAWRLMVSISLTKPPPTARPTFKFAFTPQTVFEGSGADGGAPVAKPVKHPMVIVQTMQIEFGNGSGTVWKQSKADLSITRQDGFVPGQYRLVVSGPSGAVGEPAFVTLTSDTR
jgi:hypothetical protein